MAHLPEEQPHLTSFPVAGHVIEVMAADAVVIAAVEASPAQWLSDRYPASSRFPLTSAYDAAALSPSCRLKMGKIGWLLPCFQAAQPHAA